MLNANSLNVRGSVLPVRPVVLLAIRDQPARAAHAYLLSAVGFDVVIPDATGAAFSRLNPDIVLVDLMELHEDADRSTKNFIRDLPGDVPIVALAPEVGHSSCEYARRAGCAAVCLATCSAEILSAGLRAVLERSRGPAGRAHI
jgi:DNA-binding response OmpR family regulator